jgi:hypothetical protein
VENGYIESFNGRLRDECLNGEIFFNVADAREKLDRWRRDYMIIALTVRSLTGPRPSLQRPWGNGASPS